MRTENLALKHVYYEEIRKGLKKIEYRELNDYYIRKFLDIGKYPNMTTDQIKEAFVDGKMPAYKNDVTHIQFFENGRRMIVEVKGVKVHRGHEVLCIELGKIL